MSDEASDFNYVSSGAQGGIKLGYLVQGNLVHPFSLTRHDLTNLFIIGKRAQDIYYNLLLQLCDVHHVPLIILTTSRSGGFEDQICETPIWRVNTETDHISFNPLNLGDAPHSFQQITILVKLLNHFHPLSPAARNLLHVVIWQTIFSALAPSFKTFQNCLSNYQHHGRPFNELFSLINALPLTNLQSNVDNLSLSHLVRLPMIITGPCDCHNQLLFNMLLWKLLTNQRENLPPLFLLDPPPIEPYLFRCLCLRYLKADGLLVVFDSKSSFPQGDSCYVQNLILTSFQDENCSYLANELTNSEMSLLQIHDDLVAVKLQSEPATRLVTIF